MRTLLAIPVGIVTALAASPAGASSDDAWEQFRADVAAACLKAAEPAFETATIRVDPFGSESYGLALISGTVKGSDTEIASICVYDKALKSVEIGGELPNP